MKKPKQKEPIKPNKIDKEHKPEQKVSFDDLMRRILQVKYDRKRQ